MKEQLPEKLTCVGTEYLWANDKPMATVYSSHMRATLAHRYNAHEGLVEALRDIAKNGCRHDTMPSTLGQGQADIVALYRHMESMDNHVRQVATAALSTLSALTPTEGEANDRH